MANTYQLIQSYAATGSVANIEFTSIPATYTDLVILCSLRSTAAFTSDTLFVQFNSSSANFSWENIYSTGSNPVTSSNNTNNEVGANPGTGPTASVFGNMSIYIPNYTGSTIKLVSAESLVENNATRGDNTIYSTLWSDTAAITTIKLLPSTGSFIQYSTAYLYGIKNS